MEALLDAARSSASSPPADTLPKVQLAAQVTAAAALLAMLEDKLGLAHGSIPIEPMIETPQSISDRHGNRPLLGIVKAAEGRCRSVHSLVNGIYQGWDLHPAQPVPRYAAVHSFFLEGLEAASGRLKAFVEKAAPASLFGDVFGDVFDDAATGQRLLNFFLRAIACGAITEAEALETGLSLAEIRSRSFYKILTGRRNRAAT